METDISYYRRRASQEMSAASRAVTPAARERRLYLVGIYLDRLRELNAPPPFDERQFAGVMDSIGADSPFKSAFAWAQQRSMAERA